VLYIRIVLPFPLDRDDSVAGSDVHVGTCRDDSLPLPFWYSL
jgi:hypothetical protein